MNNKIKLNRLLLAALILSYVQLGGSYAGTTTMTASNPAATVTNKTVVVPDSDTITLTTTTQNGSVAVTYTPSSGVTGPSTATATPGSPAISTFSLNSTTDGQSNTIVVSTSQTGATDSNGNACTPSTANPTFTIIVPTLDITQVTFSGAGQNQIVNITNLFATNSGGSNITQQWTPGNGSAICYNVSSSPTLTVQFKITPNLGTNSATAYATAALTQATTGNECDYDNPQSFTITGATATNTLTTADTIDPSIDNGTATIDFSYSIGDDTSGTTSDCNTSSANQIMTTLASPTVFASYIRLNYWCAQATGQTAGAGVATAIGPTAVSEPFSGSTENITNPWGLMDGTQEDCITQASLMQQSLQLLGVSGATLVYIYPRHASWNGLEQTVNNGNETNGSVILKYATPGTGSITEASTYQWEGCCKYNSLYWMGGEGASENSAYNVITANAGNPPNPWQYWDGSWTTQIPYPAGTP